MLQSILTATLTVTIAVSISYFAIGLVLSLADKFNSIGRCTAPQQVTEEETIESTTVVEEPVIEPETTEVEPIAIEIPWIESTVIINGDEMFILDRETLTQKASDELRSMCEKSGIKWRHFHGKNRHLKKPEMIEMLLG